eukprot:CAMPEP_0183747462 /NCGR_PEP_ID=MMETSP0737-20130205/67277_1 /TAXON_ID=385413 /ORGANISM="Thalassiosira miniscula, Strain CCMP1093" /LENGTH=1083 /DNA_ID=CAMNT_0025983175 /DNA_START=237 /DNA_END=3488 /DNA_ORIENTATION=+
MADKRSSSLVSVPENLSLSFSNRSKKIKAEIVDIIEEILPEEIDNVDQMLKEFQGREDELLESLRRMRMESLSDGDRNSGPIDPDDFILDTDGISDNYNDEMGAATKAAAASGGGLGIDQWPHDSDQKQPSNGDDDDDDSGSDHSLHSEPQSPKLSNPQGGTREVDQLKTPPEQLIVNALTNAPPQLMDEDENDVPPTNMVQLNQPMKLSNLTAQDWGDSDSVGEQSSGSSSLTTQQLQQQQEQPPSGGKKSIALVKLKMWDPSNPQARFTCVASTQIMLPSKESEIKKGMLQEEENVLSRKPNQKLSIVEEEPEKPPGRGSSFLDGMKGKMIDVDSSDDNEEDVENENFSSTSRRMKLRPGTLVGMQLVDTQPKHSSSISSQQMSTASVTSTYSLKRQYDWKVGNSIHLHKVNILSLTKLSELHYRVENNFTSLRQLVMDGLPPSALGMDEAELIFEALGKNTSILSLSMRYSSVDDDLASLFALALVDNTTLTKLLLEGNDMTNVSAKNFYSVLKKNNRTLRLLDLNRNPLIDEDVEQALDQFMEQRAVKRMLTNRAEKAKRAARGMPPNELLDEDEDDGGGQVTLVCPQSVIDEVRREEETEYQQSNNSQHVQKRFSTDDSSSRASSGMVKPYPGENFRDYMQRMDEQKENSHHSPGYNQRLIDESMAGREAFDTFAPLETITQSSTEHNKPLYQFQQPPTLQELQNRTLSASGSAASNCSSITTRSTQRPGTEIDIITTSSTIQTGPPERLDTTETVGAIVAPPIRLGTMETQESDYNGDNRANPGNPSGQIGTIDTEEPAYNGNVRPIPRKPPGRMGTMETQESYDDGDVRANPRKSPGRMATMETQESIDNVAKAMGTKKPGAIAVGTTQPGRSNRDFAMSSMTEVSEGDANVVAAAAVSFAPPVYHDTRTSDGSHPSLQFSEEDYMDDKAGELAIRRQLATRGSAIGAYYIDEVAYARQNRGSGGGASSGGRRGRRARTNSERQRRMAELNGEGGGTSASNNATATNTSNAVTTDNEPIIEADIELANELFKMSDRKSSLTLIGLDGEASRSDRIVCGIVAILLVVLLVLVVIFLV